MKVTSNVDCNYQPNTFRIRKWQKLKTIELGNLKSGMRIVSKPIVNELRVTRGHCRYTPADLLVFYILDKFGVVNMDHDYNKEI